MYFPFYIESKKKSNNDNINFSQWIFPSFIEDSCWHVTPVCMDMIIQGVCLFVYMRWYIEDVCAGVSSERWDCGFFQNLIRGRSNECEMMMGYCEWFLCESDGNCMS